MRIVNKTKKTIITEQAIVCSSYLSKATGLMFSHHKDLLFVFNKEKRVALHMWFVFHPIDVIYLNNKKRVMEIKEHFLPFTLYSPSQKAQYVLELSAGSVKKSKTAIADVLEFDL